MKIRNKLFNYLLSKVKKNSNGNKEIKIIDLGSGEGFFLDILYQNGFKNIEGIDAYYNLINKDIKFSKLDLSKKLDYENDSCDFITLLDVVEHVNNQYLLLDEIYRILKKDGYLILTTPSIYSILGKISFLFFNTLWGFNKSQVENKNSVSPGHINPFILNIFKELYKDKFEIVEEEYFGFIIPLINKFFGINSKLLSGNLVLLLRKK